MFLYVFVIMSGCTGKNEKSGFHPKAIISFNESVYPKELKHHKLYDKIFNIVKNKMIYYINKKYGNANKISFIIIHLSNANIKYMKTNSRLSILFAWWYDNNAIPLPHKDIIAIENNSEYENTPKVLYSINIKGSIATVYVEYWFSQNILYNEVYQIK